MRVSTTSFPDLTSGADGGWFPKLLSFGKGAQIVSTIESDIEEMTLGGPG